MKTNKSMILTKLSLLERAVNSNSNRIELPNPSEIVDVLLDLEKLAKKENINYNISDLTGSWNLRFITGTKKSRAKAGIVLGAGKYIPRLIKIELNYQTDSQSNLNTGRVNNSVILGGINLSLSGPVKFISQNNNILAFDFTAITIKLFGLKVYDGYLKNGRVKEREFYKTKIKQQAFFNYFLIKDNLIAARGRGGGLALWGRN